MVTFTHWRSLQRKTKYSIIISVFVTVYLFYVIVFGKKKSSYSITTQTVEGNSYTLAIRDRTPKHYNYTVVLLHSDVLDSSVWEDIKTLDILAGVGYRGIAIDLPGYGNSARHKAPKEDFERAFILETVLKELKATEAILVVPSMSGSYALPLVVRGSLNLKGFVPISPYTTEKFTRAEYSSLSIPTMIIYGVGDKEYGEESANRLQNIPDSKIHIIRDASHACYVQNPDEFHDILLTFLSEIELGTFDSIRKEQVLEMTLSSY